jgi:hypothetical protein
MRIFIAKISFFALVAICLNLIVNVFFENVFYRMIERNTLLEFESDLEIIRRNPDINTVFIGSSKTFRNVDPIVFDSLTNLSSYNLGRGGFFPPRTFKLISRVQEINPSFNLVIELSHLDILDENYDYLDIQNVINFKTIGNTLQYVLHSTLPYKYKVKYVLEYGRFFVVKYFGFYSSRFFYSLNNSNTFNNIDEDFGMMGYEPLDSSQDVKVIQRGEKFNLSPQEELQKVVKNYSEFLETKKSERKIINMDVFSSLVDLNKERVVFIIPPRQKEYSLNIINDQKIHLESKGFRVLDFSDPSIHPELFWEKHSFDSFHLNTLGASLYTSYLANEIDFDYAKD